MTRAAGRPTAQPSKGAGNHHSRRGSQCRSRSALAPAARAATRRRTGSALAATSANLAFGHSIHYCLGAPLVRNEGEIAFSSLFHGSWQWELKSVSRHSFHAQSFERSELSLPGAPLRNRTVDLLLTMDAHCV